MRIRVGGRAAALVAVCACALAAATAESRADEQTKAPTPPASAPETSNQTPSSLDDAVRLGRIDAATVNQLRATGMVDAILNVKFADTLDDVDVADNARVYERRKDAALDAAGSGVSERDDFEVLPATAVRVRSEAALLKLAGSAATLSVRLDKQNHADLAQSLPLIRQPQVVQAGRTGAGTSVAVLDTGTDFGADAFGACEHAGDMGCRVAFAHDFAPDDGDLDDNGHGTNVAGIVAGVAPGTDILALDVFDGDGAQDTDILDAVNWAIAHQAEFNIRALNMSLGVTGSRHTSECSASNYAGPFQIARAVGILPFVAAGNNAFKDGDYEDGVSEPGCAPGAVRVGAVYDSDMGRRGWGSDPYECEDDDTAADQITCFSQSGSLLSMLAPGSAITAAGITESGTSQATPHAAGAAAVLAAVKPGASALKIERSLTSSGPLIRDARSGVSRHRLDLVNAVANVLEPDAVVQDEGCRANTLSPNDDGSTGAVELPFVANFFSDVYTSLYVNNNGNVTFEGPQGTYTPFTISANTPPMIAPFFADVDTRGSGSAAVTYGATTYGGRRAFCVNWDGVGYYSAHADKKNSFQLLLVDRSNIGTGDFDVIFNYDSLNWETGDASGGSNGYNGTPAGAGYSAGDSEPGHFFQFPGSLDHNGLLDSNADGLVNGSRGSQQQGRYVFPIRNGLAPGTSTLQGLVTDQNGSPQAGAPVQVCLYNLTCLTTRTNAAGRYSLSGMDDNYYAVIALPPAGLGLRASQAEGIHLNAGETLTLDLVLQGTVGLPPGTTITNRGMSGSVPVIYWNDDLVLTATGCTDGQATYKITQGATTVLRSGAMTETTPGHYRATAAALYPEHGDASVEIKITCRNGADDSTFRYDIYIDPSGLVVDGSGRPVAGATVTLLRSDSPEGPFEIVPNGDAVMSPANRVNPDVSREDGAFGWDVIAGYYKVRASKDGCNGTAETGVLTIPPAVLNLRLILDCPRADTAAPVVTCAPVGSEWHAANVSVTCTASDEGSGVRGDASFTLVTDVAAGVETASAATGTRSVCDNADNCVVAGPVTGIRVDRRAPTLALPLNVVTDATAPTGAVVTYAASASDGSGASLACSPVSGARFAIGTTTVTCKATDLAGNVATGSFSVKVNSAPEQLTALTNQVLALLKLPALSTPLKTQLEAVSKAVIEKKPTIACAGMNLFVAAVKLVPTSALPVATRDKLVADANRIKAVIGC